MKWIDIHNLLSQKIRLFPFQTKDVSFAMQPDIVSSTLISLCIDKLWFWLEQFSIQYVYPFESSYDYIKSKIQDYQEDYFIFFLENYYHSNEYAYIFVNKILQYLKDNNINKKVIIHSFKTKEDDIQILMSHFTNIELFISNDIEYFFYELFYKKTSLENIANIYFRNINGGITKTKEEEVNYDLWDYIIGSYYNKYFFNFSKSKDEIIHLKVAEKREKYDESIMYLWPNEKYSQYMRSNSQDSVMLMSGRWCRFSCTYCFRWARYKTVRQIPLDVLKKELDVLEKLWYKTIRFFDDCFISTNYNRLEEINNLLSQYSFTYKIDSRYELLNEKIFKKLNSVNFWAIKIGLQSKSMQVNKEMNRNFSENHFKMTIENLKWKWISVNIDMILWLPEEVLAEFIKTLHFAISLAPNKIFINKLYLNPKTKLEENKEKYGIKTEHDTGLKKDFYVPKIHYSDTFTQKDLLIAEKYIQKMNIKLPNLPIILR